MHSSRSKRPRSSPLQRVLVAQGLSSLGTSISTVALAVMVFELTGSVLHMGAVLAASALPVMLVALLGGALLDRYGGRDMMVVADICRAGLIALMPLAGNRSVLFIYVISVGIGSFTALFNPAQVKIIGELAAREKLMRANAYMSIAREGCELGGYLIGGLLVASLGYTITFILDAGSYLASAAVLLAVARLPRAEAQPTPLGGLLRETPAALKTLWQRPALRTNILLALLPMTMILMVTPNAYALALQVFDKGPRGFALMEMITSLGWIAGGVACSRIQWRGDRNLYVASSFVIMSVFFALISVVPWFWLAVGLLAAAASANVGVIVGSVTLFQELEDRPDKGRLISIRTGLGQIAITFGLLSGGVLGEVLGVRALFLFAGVSSAALSVLVFLPYWVGVRQSGEDKPLSGQLTSHGRLADREA
jgi:MFS family permease